MFLKGLGDDVSSISVNSNALNLAILMGQERQAILVRGGTLGATTNTVQAIFYFFKCCCQFSRGRAAGKKEGNFV